jgi:hypothetical protein
LESGLLLASQVIGPGVGGTRIEYVLSRDDGLTWEFAAPVVFHDPGRAIGGRACPRTVELLEKTTGAERPARTLGTIFYDTDTEQPGGSGVFFRTWSLPSASK